MKLSQTRQILLKDDHLLLLPYLPSSVSSFTFVTLFHVPVDKFRSNYWLDPLWHSKLIFMSLADYLTHVPYIRELFGSIFT